MMDAANFASAVDCFASPLALGASASFASRWNFSAAVLSPLHYLVYHLLLRFRMTALRARSSGPAAVRIATTAAMQRLVKVGASRCLTAARAAKLPRLWRRCCSEATCAMPSRHPCLTPRCCASKKSQHRGVEHHPASNMRICPFHHQIQKRSHCFLTQAASPRRRCLCPTFLLRPKYPLLLLRPAPRTIERIFRTLLAPCHLLSFCRGRPPFYLVRLPTIRPHLPSRHSVVCLAASRLLLFARLAFRSCVCLVFSSCVSPFASAVRVRCQCSRRGPPEPSPTRDSPRVRRARGHPLQRNRTAGAGRGEEPLPARGPPRRSQ
mmetsp:Transcript_18634/g.46521  ORF Transcript_18634/g.46521 Transcript_18634/m.46521 type:complete len:322 (-) Transcript_18634:197-1162(-)